jgi:hypothetical protein
MNQIADDGQLTLLRTACCTARKDLLATKPASEEGVEHNKLHCR